MAVTIDTAPSLPYLLQLGSLEICVPGLERWIGSSLRDEPEYFSKISIAVAPVARLDDDDCDLHDIVLGDHLSFHDPPSNHEATLVDPRHCDARGNVEHTGIRAVQFSNDCELPGIS